jgi:hypothetical protein
VVAPGTRRTIQGDDLLYRFFRDLFSDDAELAERLATRMVCAMGVWLPLDVYEKFPILLPWVVRDPTCRGHKSKGIPDQWGSPNELGFLRDDNSLIKSLPRSLPIRSESSADLDGARMGNQFVASHIWREVQHPDLASRIPVLNSFVPNLVWLPKQISKLSDLEGSVVQRALQSVSWAVYRDAPVDPRFGDAVDQAWQLLPEASLDCDLPLLNWFESNERFFSTRRSRLNDVVKALEKLGAGQPVESKVVTTRYGDGLPNVTEPARTQLLRFLLQF